MVVRWVVDNGHAGEAKQTGQVLGPALQSAGSRACRLMLMAYGSVLVLGERGGEGRAVREFMRACRVCVGACVNDVTDNVGDVTDDPPSCQQGGQRV